jgi:hypothetical protein
MTDWRTTIGYRAGNTEDNIRRKFRERVRAGHPDKGGSAGAERVDMDQLKRARNIAIEYVRTPPQTSTRQTPSPSPSSPRQTPSPSFTRQTSSTTPRQTPSFTRQTPSPSFTRQTSSTPRQTPSPSFTRQTPSPSFTRQTSSTTTPRQTPSPSPSFTRQTSTPRQTPQSSQTRCGPGTTRCGVPLSTPPPQRPSPGKRSKRQKERDLKRRRKAREAAARARNPYAWSPPPAARSRSAEELYGKYARYTPRPSLLERIIFGFKRFAGDDTLFTVPIRRRTTTTRTAWVKQRF